MIADGNELVDPGLSRINYDPSTNEGADGLGTDPRPTTGSPAASGAGTVPADGFFDQTSFRGAFDPTAPLWATWTHAYQRGYLANTLVSTVELGGNDAGVRVVSSPNPTPGITTLFIDLPAASDATATVFDQVGRRVADFQLGRLQAGTNQPVVDLSQVANGNYTVVVNTSFGRVSQRIVVTR
ncbi:MAG: T9SS type A sorting domain-containing protein [Bacteroidota bacterium]